MVLPISPPDVLVPDESVVSSLSGNKLVNKAVLDNQIVQHLIPKIPALLEKGYELALSAESEGVSLDAIKYFIDRVAGKAKENIKIDQTTTSIILSQEEVAERLAHLRQTK